MYKKTVEEVWEQVKALLDFTIEQGHIEKLDFNIEKQRNKDGEDLNVITLKVVQNYFKGF